MASGQRCRETALPRSSSSAKPSRAEGTAWLWVAREVEGSKKEFKGSCVRWEESVEISWRKISTAFNWISLWLQDNAAVVPAMISSS